MLWLYSNQSLMIRAGLSVYFGSAKMPCKNYKIGMCCGNGEWSLADRKFLILLQMADFVDCTNATVCSAIDELS